MTTFFSDQLHLLKHRLSKPFTTSSSPLKAILAVGKDWLIGSGNGDLPWRCLPDLKHFKAMTDGHMLVVGYNTYKGLCETWPTSRVLLNRDVVVLFTPADSSEEALEQGRLSTLMLPINNQKTAGGRLVALPVPATTEGAIGQFSIQCLLHDIYQLKMKHQNVFIAGGAKTYELFAPFVDGFEVTLVEHNVKPEKPIYLGRDTKHAMSCLASAMPTGKAVDEVNGTKCQFYSIPNFYTMPKVSPPTSA
jgi:dihydrofolate reductase